MNPSVTSGERSAGPGTAGEPATAPGSPEFIRPRPRRRWIWVLVALATAIVLVTPPTLRFLQRQAEHHVYSGPAVFRGPLTVLVVNAPGVSVRISPGRAGQVSVASTLSWVFSKPRVSERWRGTTLRVRARCAARNPFENCQALLTIQAPAGVAVRAAVGPGIVSVSRMAGPLHLNATAGTVALAHVSGRVWAHVTTGQITGTGLASRQLAAAVTAGAAALAFSTRPERLAISVGAGSGRVTLPAGTLYRVPGRTSLHGHLMVQPGLEAPAAHSVINAHVGAGTVTIKYPAGQG